MANINAFENENGGIDWDAYHRAEIAEGDRCMVENCGAYIMNLNLFGPKRTPGPQKCMDCRRFDSEKEKVTHSDLLRCPKCSGTQQASEEWEGGIHDENDVTRIFCIHCEHEYEVETYITYTYTSPPLEKTDA